MKIVIRNLCLVLASLAVALPVIAESISPDEKHEKENIARYDEIIIDLSIEKLWPEVLNFVSWYFTVYQDRKIKHIKGSPGQVGYVLETNITRHEIISVRPMKSVAWKTCLRASCEEDYVFSDHSLGASDGETRLSRNSFSQGFWSAKYIQEIREKQSQGKVSDSLNDKASSAFKQYVENRQKQDKE